MSSPAGELIGLSVRDRDGERVLLLPAGPCELTVGRSGSADVVVAAASASSAHCQIRVDGDGRITVADLGSRNGTRLGGTPLGRREIVLRPDEVIEIGASEATIVLRPVTSIGGPPDDAARALAALAVAPGGAATAVTLGGPDGLEQDADAAGTVVRLARAVLDAGLSPERVLEVVLDELIETFSAVHGLALAIERDGTTRPVAMRNLDRATVASEAFAVSRGIVEEAARDGTTVIVGDASADRRFAGRPSVALYKIRAAAAIPLRDEGRVVGVAYVDAPEEGQGRGFDPARAPFFDALGGLLGRPLRLARRLDENERKARETRRSLAAARAELDHLRAAVGLVGRSEAIRTVGDWIEKAAGSDAPAWVSGPVGSGKGLVAHALHARGPRRDGPYVEVAVGTLAAGLAEAELFGHVKGAFTGAIRASEGLLGDADGGTIVLDGIDDLPPPLQGALLRVVESGRWRPLGGERERSADLRFVVVSAMDPVELSRSGLVRDELIQRLGVLRVRVPALEERREDIPLLVEHLLARHGPPFPKVAPDAIDLLVRARWAGNVRELENVLRELLLGHPETIEGSMVSARLGARAVERELESVPALLGAASLADARARFEHAILEQALQATGGNIKAASELLAVDRGQLHRMLKRLGIDAKAYGAPSREAGPP